MRLETKRLLVRPFTEDDLPYAAYLSDPETMKYVEPPMDAAAAMAFLRKYALCEKPYIWALEYKETGLLLGHVIFHPLETADEYELGWVLDSRVWNQGVAAESGHTLIVHALGLLEAQSIAIHTVPDHAAAQAVARKLGMRSRGETDGVMKFELRREDFFSCRG